jgi:hypothetical protein
MLRAGHPILSRSHHSKGHSKGGLRRVHNPHNLGTAPIHPHATPTLILHAQYKHRAQITIATILDFNHSGPKRESNSTGCNDCFFQLG